VKRHLLIMVVFGWFGCTREDTKPVAAVPDAGARAKLISVGPRLLSNQTSQPLSVVAEKLEVGQKLELGAPVSRAIDLVIIDERHAYGRLPPGLGASSFPEVVVEARLTGHDGVAELRLINDINFPDVSAFVLSGDGRRAFAASVTTDQILVLELASGTVTPSRSVMARLRWGSGKKARPSGWSWPTSIRTSCCSFRPLTRPCVAR